MIFHPPAGQCPQRKKIEDFAGAFPDFFPQAWGKFSEAFGLPFELVEPVIDTRSWHEEEGYMRPVRYSLDIPVGQVIGIAFRDSEKPAFPEGAIDDAKARIGDALRIWDGIARIKAAGEAKTTEDEKRIWDTVFLSQDQDSEMFKNFLLSYLSCRYVTGLTESEYNYGPGISKKPSYMLYIFMDHVSRIFRAEDGEIYYGCLRHKIKPHTSDKLNELTGSKKCYISFHPKSDMGVTYVTGSNVGERIIYNNPAA